MNETPQLRSAFPSTPQSELRPRNLRDGLRRSFGSPNSGSVGSTNWPPPPAKQPIRQTQTETKGASLIPLELVDAPSQRAYVVGLYLALLAWRLSNYWQVVDELDSTWYFLKWSVIDMLFLFGLPALRIPWLEWSFFTTLTVYLVHFVVNVFLMFHIPIPILAWVGSMLKLVYDRELSISDHRVDPAGILHNSSIILGKQIIQILPEGSAVLNPQREAFCLGGQASSIQLPVQINQTTPASIELVRYELDTDESETITIGAKQIRQLKRQADKLYHKADKSSPRVLKYAVKRTGLYQLQRVIDETKLEVRRRSFDTLVAACPEASVHTEQAHKCIDDLSDVALKVVGVPPFKVTYSKQINMQQSTSSVQSIQPPGLESPLVAGEPAGILVDPKNMKLDWARSITVAVPINESLTLDGSWSYSVEEVEDGAGNVVSYRSEANDQGASPHGTTMQRVHVHNRPRIFFDGCNSEQSLQVPREDLIRMPLSMQPTGPLESTDWPLRLTYSFAPEKQGDNDELSVDTQTVDLHSDMIPPRINMAGTYTLEHVGSNFCAGQVFEPSSCILTNPSRPDVVLTKEDLSDVCAGNTVGLKIDFEFTGTPPFTLGYTVTHEGSAEFKTVTFDGLRGQLEFRPTLAGSYEYHFLEIEDHFYVSISLKPKDLVFEQYLKPLASARFLRKTGNVQACLNQAVSVDVQLFGEAPWNLEYELVLGGKRKKLSLQTDDSITSIVTPEFTVGGQQFLILTNVRDRAGCPQSMGEELSIDVRHERPRAAFGEIYGQQKVLALEGRPVQLPLRLKGNGPWALDIINRGLSLSPDTFTTTEASSAFSVERPGTYEILNVHDSCPGIVDETANTFEVVWIDRPALFIQESAALNEGYQRYRKADVCEGDDDVLGIELTGNPPYTVKYEQRSQPLKGPRSVSNKSPIVAALGSASIPIDTSKAGEYIYTFKELSDDRYAHSKQHFTPVVVSQSVHALPSAKFTSPGKTYAYCKMSSPESTPTDAEEIPITIDGVPPFSLEIGIMHHGKTRPEVIRLKDIPDNFVSWTVPRRGSGLELGTHSVSIRSVKDGRGCARLIDHDPSSVRIRVSDPPAIVPLEYQTDYCVGEHVSFSLSGQPPFQIFYTFQDRERKATLSSTTTFRRIADGPGEFKITGVSDSASGKCRAEVDIRKIIHPMPSVQISRGKESRVEIHEGGEVDIRFDFTGTPPFEFTYTRSELASSPRGKKSKKSSNHYFLSSSSSSSSSGAAGPLLLETRHDSSSEFTKTIKASDEGAYEVMAIKDRYCAFSKPGLEKRLKQQQQQQLQHGGGGGQTYLEQGGGGGGSSSGGEQGSQERQRGWSALLGWR